MLTLWDIQADGGQVVVIKDFLNAKVGDTPAAVSIGYSTGSPDLIWAVSFVRSGLNYEFKIPDSRIQSEAAHLTKSQVLTIAANVLVTSGRRVGDPYC